MFLSNNVKQERIKGKKVTFGPLPVSEIGRKVSNYKIVQPVMWILLTQKHSRNKCCT